MDPDDVAFLHGRRLPPGGEVDTSGLCSERRFCRRGYSGYLHRYGEKLFYCDSQNFTPFFEEETLASDLWLVLVLVLVLVLPAGRQTRR